MRVFSEFWKLAVRDNDTKEIKKYKWVGKACIFLKWRIKRIRASVYSERENFKENDSIDRKTV